MKTKLTIPSPEYLMPPAPRTVQDRIRNPQSAIRNHIAITLVELLVVIAVIAILAALLMPVIGSVVKHSLIQRAQSERDQIETAIEGYKSKYGFFPPSNGFGTQATALTNQLYYELIGTTMQITNNTTNFITLDGQSSISVAIASQTFGINGFMNCSQGSGEDAHAAETFLPALKAGQIGSATNGPSTTLLLITAVSSDGTYVPLRAPGNPFQNYSPLAGNVANPWRYLCPGTNNPNSYDLWLELVVSGKTNLICNWASAPQINTSLP